MKQETEGKVSDDFPTTWTLFIFEDYWNFLRHRKLDLSFQKNKEEKHQEFYRNYANFEHFIKIK